MVNQAQDQLHQQELREFFKDKSPAVQALQAEYQVCLDNARDSLEAINVRTEGRDFYAGAVYALKQVMAIQEKYRDEPRANLNERSA